MFEALDLARLQFALTSIYHWLFVPFTLGDDGYRSHF